MASMEAAFVGLMMITGVVVYVSTDTPPGTASINPARDPLEALVGDVLEGLKDSPTTTRYATLLEQSISRAVQGNTTEFDHLIKRLLPPGAQCRLWLDNGHEKRQVAGPTERLARESVSKAKLWRPQWAYAFAVPSLDVISDKQPLHVQTYEVSQGALVKEYGVPLQWTLTTDKATYDRASILGIQPQATATVTLKTENNRNGYVYADPSLTEATSTLSDLQQSGSPPSPHTFNVPVGQNTLDLKAVFNGTAITYTLTFQDPLGATYPMVLAAHQVPAVLSIPTPQPGTWTMTGSGTHTGTPLVPATSRVWINTTALDSKSTFTFTLREEAGHALPKGTTINITFPQVMYDLELTNKTQTGWRNITPGESLLYGAWVSAELNQSLTNDALDLVVRAHRPPTGNALYEVHATLSNGAHGRATFILGLPQGATTAANTIEHNLYISAPKPQAPGSTAHWGAVFPNPRLLPGLPEVVKQLDIYTTTGQAIFDTAPPVGITPDGIGTWTRVNAGHIRWTGELSVHSNKAAGFSFKVKLANTASADHEPSVIVPMQFNTGTTFTSHAQEKPYVHVITIPPPLDVVDGQQAGYEVPNDATPTARGNATANITQLQRGMLAKGEVVYGVSQFGTLSSLQEALRLGLARSHLNLTKQAVKIGEETNLTVDFQGLYDEIVVLGATVTGWKVETFVYDPAQPFLPISQMHPSFHGSFGASGQIQFSLVPLTGPDAITEWALSRTPDVRTAALANFTFTPPRGSFYGPHAVLAQATFVVQDGLGTSMAQSVRQVALVDVIPDGGQSGTALYWASLECWLLDW